MASQAPIAQVFWLQGNGAHNGSVEERLLGDPGKVPNAPSFQSLLVKSSQDHNETGGGVGACSGSQDSGGNLDEIWKDFMCLLYLNVLSRWVLLCMRTTFFPSPGIRPVLTGYAKGFCSSPHYLIWNSIGDRISSAQEEINDVLEGECWCQWFFVKSPAAMTCEQRESMHREMETWGLNKVLPPITAVVQYRQQHRVWRGSDRAVLIGSTLFFYLDLGKELVAICLHVERLLIYTYCIVLLDFTSCCHNMVRGDGIYLRFWCNYMH